MNEEMREWIPGCIVIGTIATAIYLWSAHGPYPVPKYVDYQSIADDADAASEAAYAHLVAEILTDDSEKAISNIRAAYLVFRKMRLATMAAQDKADKEQAEADKQAAGDE
jgi:hypothetical protein